MNREDVSCEKCGHDIWNISILSDYMCAMCNHIYGMKEGEELLFSEVERNGNGNFVYSCKMSVIKKGKDK